MSINKLELGGNPRGQEDHGSKPARANSLRDPSLKIFNIRIFIK
jgi:hypothetical protein